jgi:hypothetical protein
MKNSTEGENQPERILTRVKISVGEDGGGFGYHLDAAPLIERPDIEATRIVWDSALEGEARQLLAEVETDDSTRAPKFNVAKAWLMTRLKASRRLATVLKEEAKALGISEKTLYRAAAKIGVKKYKGSGLDDPWIWSLEDDTAPY